MTVTQETVDLSQRFRLVFSASRSQALPLKTVIVLRNALLAAERWDDLSDKHQELLLAAETEVSRWR